MATANVPYSHAAAARNQRWFYTAMAVAAALVIFIGFAPSYYLKPFTGAGPLPPLVHMHGAVFTAWVILFVVQVRLVDARQLRLHRRLGVGAVVLSAAMMVLGTLTMFAAARRHGTAPFGLTGAQFMLIPLIDILIFGTLVTFAVVYRRRGAVHKRLMLLALTGGLLPAPLARIGIMLGLPVLFPLLLSGALAAGVVHDRMTLGRVHPVNRWVPIVVFITVPLRLLIARTAAWDALARWLIG